VIDEQLQADNLHARAEHSGRICTKTRKIAEEVTAPQILDSIVHVEYHMHALTAGANVRKFREAAAKMVVVAMHIKCFYKRD
jgi:hypothetical protein